MKKKFLNSKILISLFLLTILIISAFGIFPKSKAEELQASDDSFFNDVQMDELNTNEVNTSVTTEIEPIDLKISLSQTPNDITATISGNDLEKIEIQNYIFQWKRASDEVILKEGNLIETINLENGNIYVVEALNNQNPDLNLMTTFTYKKDELSSVIFVDEKNGVDTNDGIKDTTPVKSVYTALEKIKKVAKENSDENSNIIVIMSECKLPEDFKIDIPVTITSIYNGLSYDGVLLSKSNINLGATVKFENITFDGEKSNTIITCDGNNLIMGDGLQMKNYSTYEKQKDFRIFSSSNLTINSGEYSIIASNRSVETKENSFKSTINLEYTKSSDPSKIDVGTIISGNYDGTSGFFDSTINIKNASISRIIGGSISNSEGTNFFEGDSNINIAGGYIKEIYGASFANQVSNSIFKGNININITGGEIEKDLISAGNFTKTEANINLNIKDGIFKENIYGAGNGETKGTINVNVFGGTIKGNIYGGGNLADVIGDITLLIDGINKKGNIYGGGNKAKIDGNTKVKILSGNIDGKVFAGGNLGDITQNVELIIGDKNSEKNITISESIYAGSDGANVYQNANYLISGTNTKIQSFALPKSGTVIKDTNITFLNYFTSSKEKFKLVKGINKVSNLVLQNSFIEFEDGLKNVRNLSLLENSSLYVPENIEILGNFTGTEGTTLYLNNATCFTIKGDVLELSKTKFIVKSGQAKNITSGKENPYIKIFGNDLTSGNAFESGIPARYKILFDNEKAIYYVEKKVYLDGYMVSTSAVSEGKKYNEQIEFENPANVYILQNQTFSGIIKNNYYLKDENDLKCQNVSRNFVIYNNEDGLANMTIPAGTQIIMKYGNDLYGYFVKNSVSQVSLSDFKKLETNENFVEESDLYSSLKSEGTYQEEFRFVVDFSKSEAPIYSGEYVLSMELNDGENGYGTSEYKNLLLVEDRYYNVSQISLDKHLYEQNSNISINGTLDVGIQNEKINSNIKLSAMIHLEDLNGNFIKIPMGSKIVFGNKEYPVLEQGLVIDILKNFGLDEKNTNFKIDLDMTGVIKETEKLEKGNYKLIFDLYASDNEDLVGTKISTSKLDFEISDIKDYGINVQILNTMNLDKLQLVTNGDKRNFKIETNYEKIGDAILKIELKKRSGPFSYIDVPENKINKTININGTIKNEELTFNSLEQGKVYRIVFKLCDKNETVYSYQNMNFIVE